VLIGNRAKIEEIFGGLKALLSQGPADLGTCAPQLLNRYRRETTPWKVLRPSLSPVPLLRVRRRYFHRRDFIIDYLCLSTPPLRMQQNGYMAITHNGLKNSQDGHHLFDVYPVGSLAVNLLTLSMRAEKR
ncbi:MAG TPA: hypothetical protein DCR97_10810, partial [Deltaproteobacteria bacterium]|nr:hypothetical protein [Deltaproteobacteria bacterium]